eukprot:15483450-Alexandrium_andersonii.AAC.1
MSLPSTTSVGRARTGAAAAALRRTSSLLPPAQPRLSARPPPWALPDSGCCWEWQQVLARALEGGCHEGNSNGAHQR